MSDFWRAPHAVEKTPEDTYDVSNGDPVKLDFTAVLPTGVTIATVTSTTVKPITSPALTVANGAANGSAYVDDDGATVAIGKAVLMDCSGGRDGSDYEVTVTVTLSSGSVRSGVLPVVVRN